MLIINWVKQKLLNCKLIKFNQVFLKLLIQPKLSFYELHVSSQRMACFVVSNSVIPNSMQKSILQPHYYADYLHDGRFSKSFHFSNIWCFLERLFAQNYSIVVANANKLLLNEVKAVPRKYSHLIFTNCRITVTTDRVKALKIGNSATLFKEKRGWLMREFLGIKIIYKHHMYVSTTCGVRF